MARSLLKLDHSLEPLLRANKEVLLETGAISKEKVFDILGDKTFIISAMIPLTASPLEALVAKTAIPDDFSYSIAMRTNYLLAAMRDVIKLTDSINEFEGPFTHPEKKPPTFSNKLQIGLVTLKTSFVKEEDGIKIICRAEQDGKLVGEIIMKFPIFENGMRICEIL